MASRLDRHDNWKYDNLAVQLSKLVKSEQAKFYGKKYFPKMQIFLLNLVQTQEK